MFNKAKGAGIALAICFFALSGCSDSHHTVLLDPDGTLQGSGIPSEESRPVSGIEEVILAGVGQLHIEQGAAESLRIVGDDNLVPLLEVTVESGVLTIRRPGDDNISPTLPLQYFLTVNNVERVTLAGVGNVQSSGLKAATLDLRMIGVGDIDMTGLGVGRLNTELTGVGSMTLAGNVDEQHVVKSGVGSYDALGLGSATTDVTLTGFGTVSVNATDRLTVTIDGPGTVQYTGDPTVTSTITGGGHVQPVGG